MFRRPSSAEQFAAERERMVVGQLTGRGIRDAATLRAMRVVPRERFVPSDSRSRAYADGALSIGEGQTISQPFIVALTTEALGLGEWRGKHPGQRPRVLDVGLGSGYQAAVLAEIGADVTAIELVPKLAKEAADRLKELGYAVNVE